MAPGELVKTATNFGLETISSGTSMAAPHVVGVASILWQKDKSKPVDFIRRLIEESAKEITNKGEDIAIIDAQYALNKYTEFNNNYNDESYRIKENINTIDVTLEMEKVTARWSKDNHAALVTNNRNTNLTTEQLKWIRAGIRYNDRWLSNDYSKQEMWHSLKKHTREPNYMAAMSLVGKIINKKDCNTSSFKIGRSDSSSLIAKKLIPGLTKSQQNQMVSDINGITIAKLRQMQGIGSKDTLNDTKKRLVLLGMELHIITDAFAHRAYIRKPYLSGIEWRHWIHLGEKSGHNPDSVTTCPNRYKAAGTVVKNVLNQCLSFDRKELVMAKTALIKSKQIMYNNGYFDGSFLIERLVFNGENNSINDNTFNTWKSRMASNTYTSIMAEQNRIASFY